MAGARGGRLRGPLAGALVCSLALVLGGCGLTSTKGDRKRAAELAEERYPGLLDVISARSLFPQTGGSEVTFSVADDPDAAVRLRIDAEAGTCERGDCGRALDEAVVRGREQAESLRRMRSAFSGCGYEIVGVDPGFGTPWVVASPTNATVTRVFAEIGACVRAWSAVRGEKAAPEQRTLSVRIAAPETARARPAGDPAVPTVLRLTDDDLLAALAERPSYTVTYVLRDGTADPASGRAYISRPWKYETEFGATVQKAVGTWLRASYPQAVVGMHQGIWWLEPGTVDRLTGRVLFCDGPVEGRRCPGDHAVELTADPEGNPVGDLRVVRNI